MESVTKLSNKESDPDGKNPHERGAKLDAGKSFPALVIRGFSKAISKVVEVGTFGALKYSRNGWMYVENGLERYEDALYRHLLADLNGETLDPETKLPHLAHAAWNILAIIELREKNRPIDTDIDTKA